MSLLLGVNIDHVATLRQARYANASHSPVIEPSILEAAWAAQRGGGDSITIHVREDRRHMQDEDARLLRRKLDLPLNLELANTPEMVRFACELRPDFACLVPEKREEVTTEGGLDVLANYEALAQNIPKLQAAGIKVSLFIDPESSQVEKAADLGVEMIELHTGSFALATKTARVTERERLARASLLGHNLGLRVNAGHGIQLENLSDIFYVKFLSELNVGHSLVSRAIFIGLEAAVSEMKAAMKAYPSS